MKKILYLDPIGGVAGDMFSAAFLDTGVITLEELQNNVALVVPEIILKAENCNRGGIQGTQLHVISPEGEELPGVPHSCAFVHHHDEHHHEHHHRKHDHHPYKEIFQRLQGSKLVASVKNLALAIFQKLAEAEAHVHSKKIEDIAFHEIGRNDAIADVVCAAVSMLSLKNTECVCGPIPFGQGVITFSHGTMSVPAPAVLEILKGMPTVPGYPIGEMTTPTGAAIVVTCSSSFKAVPPLIPQKIGYGHGSRIHEGYPNSFRIIIGEAQ